MLKAKILKVLKESDQAPTLAEVVEKVSFANINPTTVYRILVDFEKAGVVLKFSTVTPRYALTELGGRIEAELKDFDDWGQKRWEEIPWRKQELIHLMLKLGVIEEKRGMVKMITLGCGYSEEIDMKIVPCPVCSNLIPVQGQSSRDQVRCQECGTELAKANLKNNTTQIAATLGAFLVGISLVALGSMQM